MERTERSFIKNGKEWKERNVLLKRTDAQPWIFPVATAAALHTAAAFLIYVIIKLMIEFLTNTWFSTFFIQIHSVSMYL